MWGNKTVDENAHKTREAAQSPRSRADSWKGPIKDNNYHYQFEI